MSVVVQKYGGSSVADLERVRSVARVVARRRRDGDDVVVVVSAMGATTDELLAMAKALAPSIQVNCISPGPVLFPENYSEEERKFSIEQTLLKREGSAEDIAKTVRFLLEGSDYITGAVIPVDGGRQVR